MIRKIMLLTAVVFLFASGALAAHESWIEARALKQGIENILIVKIGNGHHFPRSNMAVSKRIVNKVIVTDASGKNYVVTMTSRGNYLEGRIAGLAIGTCIIRTTLKNPPRYFLTAIIPIGKRNSSAAFMKGELLEIVPLDVPAAAFEKGRLKLRILFKGKPVTADLSVSINGRRNFSTYTDSRGEFTLRLVSRGKYLISTSFGGKMASLVIVIP